MRKLSLVLGLLLVPAMAGAQNVEIDLVAGAHPGPYSSSLDGSGFGPGSQFILWSLIHTDIDVDGVEYKLHVNGDADNNKFDLVGYAIGPLSPLEPILALPPGTLSGYGTGFAFAGPPTGFATADYTKKAPASLDALAGSEAIFNNTAKVSGLEGKTLIGYVIEANANFVVGNYEFSALGPIGGGPTAEWTSTPDTGRVLEGASFILTPEPTSALLLLAAVPFLRRRRA